MRSWASDIDLGFVYKIYHTLSKEGGLSSLVLCNTMNFVLLAFTLAVGAAFLRYVNCIHGETYWLMRVSVGSFSIG